MNTIIDQISEAIRLQRDLDLKEMIPLSQIEEIFEQEEYEREYEDNPLNGWEVDFWYHFSHATKPRYCVSGSLWYGNFKISKHEKDTTEEEIDV